MNVRFTKGGAEMKICVLFPGIGYTPDKPLLYYAGKLYKSRGYEVISVNYGELPKKAIGDSSKMKKTFEMAMEIAQEELSQIEWGEYSEIVFVGKSIGTIVAAAYAKENGELAGDEGLYSKIRFIYMTPLAETFIYAREESGIAFHGTADPWVKTEVVETECKRLNIPLYVYPDANHSLETGDIMRDIDTVKKVVSLLV